MKIIVLYGFLSLVACLTCEAQGGDFPQLSGPYLGQKPPSVNPEPFAAQIPEIHRFLHSGIVFSPDGHEAYWKPEWNPVSPIYQSGIQDGYWTTPEPAVFSMTNSGDDSPFISPKGDRLFFISQRAEKHKEIFWVTEKSGNTWSDPLRISEIVNSTDFIHWQFSTDTKGNLYFGAGGKGNGKEGYIYCSPYENGHYLKPYMLGPEINQPGIYNYSPNISPDGSILLFTRNQNPASLHISFKDVNGNWSKAQNMNEILRCTNCFNPFLTVDGLYLFFLSEGFPYWVSARIIETFRPAANK